MASACPQGAVIVLRIGHKFFHALLFKIWSPIPLLECGLDIVTSKTRPQKAWHCGSSLLSLKSFTLREASCHAMRTFKWHCGEVHTASNRSHAMRTFKRHCGEVHTASNRSLWPKASTNLSGM